MIVPKYFEDFDHLHVNTMPNRAYYLSLIHISEPTRPY